MHALVHLENSPFITRMENILWRAKYLHEPLLACRAAVRLNQAQHLIMHSTETFHSV